MSTAGLPVNVRLRPESAGLTMSPEEFDAVTDYDQSVNYELIRGVLVVARELSRPPEFAHHGNCNVGGFT